MNWLEFIVVLIASWIGVAIIYRLREADYKAGKLYSKTKGGRFYNYKYGSKKGKRGLTKKRRSKYNTYAVCRAMQKKYNWSEVKYKSCVAKIIAKQKERELEENEEELGDDMDDESYGDY